MPRYDEMSTARTGEMRHTGYGWDYRPSPRPAYGSARGYDPGYGGFRR